MGERAKLKGPFGGQFSLNDWLGQINNRATPQDLVKTIVPVQEMREFQRRYRFDQGSQNLLIGEQLSQVIWQVPENENWKPLAVWFANGDPGKDHDIISRIVIPGVATFVDWDLARTRVSQNGSKRIFGTTLDGSLGTGDSDFMSTSPIILQPGHSFSIIDTDTVSAGTSVRWAFLYELVPQPATQLVRGVVGLATVV